jgi:hypothetical protein
MVLCLRRAWIIRGVLLAHIFYDSYVFYNIMKTSITREGKFLLPATTNSRHFCYNNGMSEDDVFQHWTRPQ